MIKKYIIKFRKIFLSLSILSILPLIAGPICVGISSNMSKSLDNDNQKVESGIGFSNYKNIKVDGYSHSVSSFIYYEYDDGFLKQKGVWNYDDIKDYYQFWSLNRTSEIEKNRVVNVKNSYELYQSIIVNKSMLIAGATLIGVFVTTILICVPCYVIARKEINIEKETK